MAIDRLFIIVNRKFEKDGLPCYYTGQIVDTTSPVFSKSKSDAKEYTRAAAETAVDTVLDLTTPIASQTATDYDIEPLNKVTV